jgi:hypothetical protein
MFPFAPQNYKSPYAEHEDFKALITLSNVFWVIGWLVIIIAFFTVVILLGSSSTLGENYSVLTGIAAIPAGIVLIFFGLINLAISELIKVILKIEKNTRKRFEND